jgi:UDP-N-acetylglucosamine acyltransferase
MAYVHVAHDCRVGDNVVLANAVNMGGHVEIEDWVIVGGMVAVHQFVKIGQHSMIGGGFKVVKDVPPYIIAGNMPLRFEGVNKIGLQRRGFTSEQIVKINEVYNIIYKSKYNVTDAVKKVKDDIQQDEFVKTILDFIDNSKRGIIRGQFIG